MWSLGSVDSLGTMYSASLTRSLAVRQCSLSTVARSRSLWNGAPPRTSTTTPTRTMGTTSNAAKRGSWAKNPVLKAGLPLVLFSVLASWVVSNAVDGKLRELETSQGKVSKSLRQAKLEEEHDEMMERLNKIAAADFDNTRRIKRPHEILEERRLERERRNRWHRRLYRWVTGQKEV